MGHNRFFDPSSEHTGEKPRAVLARFDSVEGDRVYLEAADTDWLVNVLSRETGDQFEQALADWAPIAVLEINAGDYIRFGGSPYDLAQDDQQGTVAADDPAGWVSLRLDGEGEGAAGEGVLYLNLYAEGVVTPVQRGDDVDPTLLAALSESLSLDAYLADEEALGEAVSRLAYTRIEIVGVYDVGQGGANALCDFRGIPLCYVDYGGGVLGHVGSFPTAMTGFCATARPPVILSHWDWDHWSSGSRFPNARLPGPWIAPNQTLGVVHRAFAASLAIRSQLLVWPANLSGLTIGQLTIVKCCGSGRNHSGLAVTVAGPNGEPDILLTGDARYSAIPGPAGKTYTAVVAPHHGADMRSGYTPGPGNPRAPRVAYSYGQGNQWGHPQPITEQRHHTAAWPHASLGGSVPVDRHTSRRSTGGLGHIALRWDGLTSLPSLPCRGRHCSLQLTQT